MTERKKRELALQASERRFRQLADLIPGVVGCQTGDLSASYLSERWFEYTGLRDAERESLLQVVHPDDMEPLYERLAAALKTKNLIAASTGCVMSAEGTIAGFWPVPFTRHRPDRQRR